MPIKQVGIRFARVGDDIKGAEDPKQADEELKQKDKLDLDFVDIKNLIFQDNVGASDNEMLALILGGIIARFDNKAERSHG